MRVEWEPASGEVAGGCGLDVWRARDPLPGRSPQGDFSARVTREILGVYFEGGLPEMCREERGRPFLAGRPLDFNVSHSRGWLVLAVSRRCRVGIDIEEVRDTRDLVGIAERFFAEAEAEAVRAKGVGEFYRLWAAKEAALKLGGEGIAGGMAHARPRWDAEGRGRVEMADGRRRGLLLFEAAPGFQGAVVWERAEPPSPRWMERR